MRGLAAGEKDYEKYRKLFQEKFVFLNEYTTSVQAEHDPRGPEGPYRFQDRSVPVLVFKRWDGKTLIQQLGFQPDPERAKRALAQLVDRALKENGPVVPPKQLRPLLKSHEKALGHLEKGFVASAIRELEKVVKAAADEKKFPEKPDVALQAEEQLKRIEREYGRLDGIKEKAKEALQALPGE